MSTQSSNSKRVYEIVIHEPTDGFHQFKLSIDEIMFPNDKNPFEYIYALQEITDTILDLQRGKSMVFRPNRDNDTELGIIARVE